MTFKNGFILQTYGIEDLHNSFFFISLKIENIYNFALVLELKFQSKSTTSNALPSSKTTAATSAKSIELLCHTTIKSNFA